MSRPLADQRVLVHEKTPHLYHRHGRAGVPGQSFSHTACGYPAADCKSTRDAGGLAPCYVCFPPTAEEARERLNLPSEAVE